MGDSSMTMIHDGFRDMIQIFLATNYTDVEELKRQGTNKISDAFINKFAENSDSEPMTGMPKQTVRSIVGITFCALALGEVFLSDWEPHEIMKVQVVEHKKGGSRNKKKSEQLRVLKQTCAKQQREIQLLRALVSEKDAREATAMAEREEGEIDATEPGSESGAGAAGTQGESD